MSLQKFWKWGFIVCAVSVLCPKVSSAQALLAGLAATLLFGNPWLDKTKKLAPKLLAYSVVGLGAGMNLKVVLQVGASGVLYTVCGIAITLTLGGVIGKILRRSEEHTSELQSH